MYKNAPYDESKRPAPDKTMVRDRHKALSRIRAHEVGFNVEKDTSKTRLKEFEIITLTIFGIIFIIILMIVLFG